ncbi:MAG: RpiB/LacA/LacB family sugar-phosphate isomerase [Candidatus Paceibacterota bacterium]
MIIYLGADHRGFELKEQLKSSLESAGYEFSDLGNSQYEENDDYNEFASRVSEVIAKDTSAKGILICGSGTGMNIVANKFRGIRACLCFSADQAMMFRSHDDGNILCLASNFTNPEMAKKIVSVWLQTNFDNDPDHKRRLQKISELEMKTTHYL